MKYNTRFVPTINGPLHLGHLYTILINQTEAHRTGGKFIIRYDDTQRYWNWKHDDREIEHYKRLIPDDLDWLGIKPDVWSSQAELMREFERTCIHLRYEPPEQPFQSHAAGEVAGMGQVYPYCERLTAEHVVMDWLEGVNWVIRGIDLLSEDCLYRYFIDRMGLLPVRTTYIPRLQFDGETVSKTAGRYKLVDYRQIGIRAEVVLYNLAQDCLLRPGDAWKVDNVKPNPILGTWARELLHGVSE